MHFSSRWLKSGVEFAADCTPGVFDVLLLRFRLKTKRDANNQKNTTSAQKIRPLRIPKFECLETERYDTRAKTNRYSSKETALNLVSSAIIGLITDLYIHKKSIEILQVPSFCSRKSSWSCPLEDLSRLSASRCRFLDDIQPGTVDGDTAVKNENLPRIS